MKILIADDEELVRLDIRNQLLEIEPGYEIHEAVNGRELIRLVDEINPDLCFVDIRMPGISGLEAIETISAQKKDILWIILSGYSEFQYARKAINLGIMDYLLKPAATSELKAVMIRAGERIEQIKATRLQLFEQKVSAVLNNTLSEEFDTYFNGTGRFSGMVFCLSASDQQPSAEIFNMKFSELRSDIYKIDHRHLIAVVVLQDGSPALITSGADPERLVKTIAGKLEDTDAFFHSMVLIPENESLGGLIADIEKIDDYSSVEVLLSGQRICSLGELIYAGESKPSVPTAPADTAEISDRSVRLVRQAEVLVREKYMEAVGVAQIADLLNVTPNYLSSIFKKHKAMPFTRFITDIRLEEASRKLGEPGVTVKEVATGLGYQSSRHFARLFKEKYGKSPSDFIAGS